MATTTKSAPKTRPPAVEPVVSNFVRLPESCEGLAIYEPPSHWTGEARKRINLALSMAAEHGVAVYLPHSFNYADNAGPRLRRPNVTARGGNGLFYAAVPCGDVGAVFYKIVTRPRHDQWAATKSNAHKL